MLLSLIAVAGGLVLTLVDLCAPRTPGAPRLVTSAGAEGSLRAGASRVRLEPSLPLPLAGYFPPLEERAAAEPALQARAVVLEVAPHSVGLVSLDLLSVPDDVVAEVRSRIGATLGEVWVLATHTHSSFGGYDSRPVAQVAALGRFRSEARAAVVEAAVRALQAARAALQPVQLAVGTQGVAGLVRARSGEPPDDRFTRVVLTGARGRVAELWHVAAHPTLAGREPPALTGDFPALLDDDADGPVRLLLQGAVGNASAVVPDGEGEAPVRFARALREVAEQVTTVPAGPVALRTARVEVGLPRPDASRLLPRALAKAGDNLLCTSAPLSAQVSALRLGPVVLVALPGEPTSGAVRALESASHAGGVVALANGYVGYLDTRALVEAREGEAQRQYFGPELLEVLTEAATVGVGAVR